MFILTTADLSYIMYKTPICNENYLKKTEGANLGPLTIL